MLVAGAVGMVINLAAAWVLHPATKDSLNVEGAFLHGVGELLGSIVVVTAGLLTLLFGWKLVDP